MCRGGMGGVEAVGFDDVAVAGFAVDVVLTVVRTCCI